MDSNLLHFDTAESFLGEGKKRYFSSGYKKIKYRFERYIVADNKLTGMLNVEWPIVWAQKNNQSLSPHLGTLEFYVIAAQLSESYLEIIENFSAQDIAHTWISYFKIKAGSEAETMLEQEECTCRQTSVKKGRTGEVSIFLFEVKIGKSIICLTLSHTSVQKGQVSKRTKKTPESVPLSYFTTGYKIPVHRIFNIRLNKATRVATAEIEMLNQELMDDFQGIGRKYQPCFSYADAILVAGQLSQILLFNLDGLTRQTASNLWMRQIESKYHQPLGDRFAIELRADDFKLVKLKENNFRTSNLHLRCSDQMTAQLKFAYQL